MCAAADIDVPKQGGNAYSENHFVHMPPFFKAGMLRLTCKDMGRGKDIFKGQELCFAMYKDECEYVQAAGDPGNCIVCKSGGSEDVGDVNVKGRDLTALTAATRHTWRPGKTTQAAEHRPPPVLPDQRRQAGAVLGQPGRQEEPPLVSARWEDDCAACAGGS